MKQRTLSHHILKYPIFYTMILIYLLYYMPPIIWYINVGVIGLYLILKITRINVLMKKILRHFKYRLLNKVYNKTAFTVITKEKGVYEIWADYFKSDRRYTFKIIRNVKDKKMYFFKYEVLSSKKTILVEQWEETPDFFINRERFHLYLKGREKKRR